MKITITFDDGNAINISPEALELHNQDSGITLMAKLNSNLLPLLGFQGKWMVNAKPEAPKPPKAQKGTDEK